MSLRKVLNGDLPLARVFWVGLLLLPLVFRMLEGLASALFPALRGAMAVIFGLFAIGYAPIILLATWRSSHRYGGPHFWGAAARAIVLPSVAGFSTAVVAGVIAGFSRR